MTLAAVDIASRLAIVDAVRLTAIFDPLDAVGPLARKDVKKFPDRAIVRASGEWAYVDRSSNASEVEFPDGTRFHCQPVDVLDVPSVALATGARDVSFSIGLGESLGRRRGSRSCPDAGSLSGPLRGSVATAASSRTSSRTSPRQPHGCSSPQSSSSHAASQEHEIYRDGFESDS
jgi:hypothetical protein